MSAFIEEVDRSIRDLRLLHIMRNRVRDHRRELLLADHVGTVGSCFSDAHLSTHQVALLAINSASFTHLRVLLWQSLCKLLQFRGLASPLHFISLRIQVLKFLQS